MEKKEAIDKHVEMIADAARQGAQVVGLQEIFFGPYFCAEQDPKWYATAEPDDGPTVTLMQEVARDPTGSCSSSPGTRRSSRACTTTPRA